MLSPNIIFELRSAAPSSHLLLTKTTEILWAVPVFHPFEGSVLNGLRAAPSQFSIPSYDPLSLFMSTRVLL